MRITYRNFLITPHDDGRYVALDPSEPNAFKIFSKDLRRIYNAIDDMWSALAAAPPSMMLDHGEVDLDAVVVH
ncbi:hypothetical protein [Bradyrhizobium japonicum]|uniref:hypothetical protein n=1 Tax=Bradyrhizobium japonicum TaxID=375 RepID=UPI000559B87C|nr:hypothetical protein [Bradyrhizobium japonicum]AJA62856.1 hypothetical protein RN69_22830 [Bradyrhizobium japonicum]MCS3540612.1 hypothetical protein [Bradyrhizobium japonicum]MCS4208992.1 hypothetical protein [Bradyrhizobium japonicum]MYV83010.1 hypothetical protein [Bradyrhizobium japonicum]